jgi:hypothetical protein
MEGLLEFLGVDQRIDQVGAKPQRGQSGEGEIKVHGGSQKKKSDAEGPRSGGPFRIAIDGVVLGFFPGPVQRCIIDRPAKLDSMAAPYLKPHQLSV